MRILDRRKEKKGHVTSQPTEPQPSNKLADKGPLSSMYQSLSPQRKKKADKESTYKKKHDSGQSTWAQMKNRLKTKASSTAISRTRSQSTEEEDESCLLVNNGHCSKKKLKRKCNPARYIPGDSQPKPEASPMGVTNTIAENERRMRRFLKQKFRRKPHETSRDTSSDTATDKSTEQESPISTDEEDASGDPSDNLDPLGNNRKGFVSEKERRMLWFLSRAFKRKARDSTKDSSSDSGTDKSGDEECVVFSEDNEKMEFAQMIERPFSSAYIVDEEASSCSIPSVVDEEKTVAPPLRVRRGKSDIPSPTAIQTGALSGRIYMHPNYLIIDSKLGNRPAVFGQDLFEELSTVDVDDGIVEEEKKEHEVATPATPPMFSFAFCGMFDNFALPTYPTKSFDVEDFPSCTNVYSAVPRIAEAASKVRVAVATKSSIKKFRCTRTVQSKRVSFGSVQVRRYERAVSNHPPNTGGPPIGLGWLYLLETTMNVPEHQLLPPKRHRKYFHLSVKTRTNLLGKGWNVSDQDMQHAAREATILMRSREQNQFPALQRHLRNADEATLLSI